MSSLERSRSGVAIACIAIATMILSLLFAISVGVGLVRRLEGSHKPFASTLITEVAIMGILAWGAGVLWKGRRPGPGHSRISSSTGTLFLSGICTVLLTGIVASAVIGRIEGTGRPSVGAAVILGLVWLLVLLFTTISWWRTLFAARDGHAPMASGLSLGVLAMLVGTVGLIGAGATGNGIVRRIAGHDSPRVTVIVVEFAIVALSVMLSFALWRRIRTQTRPGPG